MTCCKCRHMGVLKQKVGNKARVESCICLFDILPQWICVEKRLGNLVNIDNNMWKCHATSIIDAWTLFLWQICFENYERAKVILHNVLSLLKAGGYFIGITPDSSMIWYGIVIGAVICSHEEMFVDPVAFCICRLLCTLCFLRANLPMLMLLWLPKRTHIHEVSLPVKNILTFSFRVPGGVIRLPWLKGNTVVYACLIILPTSVLA